MMLVKEIEHLMWKTNADGSTTPVLDEALDPDGHSDLCAALRYFGVSFTKPVKIDYTDDVGGVLPYIEGIG